jgi:hypothetical protein
MPTHCNNHLPSPPWISLLIPHPVNIVISNNKFIEFFFDGSNYVGLIVNLNASERTLVIRKILASEQLLQHVPLIANELLGV